MQYTLPKRKCIGYSLYTILIFFIYLDETTPKNVVYTYFMNTFQKIIYFFLEIQEKHLRKKLEKHLKTSSKNSTSKTVLSSSVTMTLNAETQKNIEIVKKNVADIVKSCENNSG